MSSSTNAGSRGLNGSSELGSLRRWSLASTLLPSIIGTSIPSNTRTPISRLYILWATPNVGSRSAEEAQTTIGFLNSGYGPSISFASWNSSWFHGLAVIVPQKGTAALAYVRSVLGRAIFGYYKPLIEDHILTADDRNHAQILQFYRESVCKSNLCPTLSGPHGPLTHPNRLQLTAIL